MKVFIIGRSGQLARSLATAPWPASMEPLFAGRRQLDITDADAVWVFLQRLHPDMIINTAAYTAVDKAEEESEAAFAVNAEGPAYLARACRRIDAPLLHISTDYVFDGRQQRPHAEHDRPTPVNVYGQSKLAGEQAVRATWKKHLILRTAWLFSPFGHNFVRSMLRLAATRDTIRVVDDQKGSPTHAPHLARGILQVLQALSRLDREKPVWGIYHMAGSGATTWCGLAREVMACSQALGGPWAMVEAIDSSAWPAIARRPAYSALDCAKLEQVFGLRLPAWQDGVAECVARCLDNEKRQRS